MQTAETKTIMVVDDEPMVANLLQEFLQLSNYKVEKFTDSKQALATFSKVPEQYDLVLTDYTMPGMTGTELSKRLLEINDKLPIVLCTGYSENINAGEAKKMGISAYLNKPVSRNDLISTIDTLTAH